MPGLSLDEKFQLTATYMNEVKKFEEEAQKKVEQRLKIDLQVYQSTITSFLMERNPEVNDLVTNKFR